jgi:hypothetical protein
MGELQKARLIVVYHEKFGQRQRFTAGQGGAGLILEGLSLRTLNYS